MPNGPKLPTVNLSERNDLSPIEHDLWHQVIDLRSIKRALRRLERSHPSLNVELVKAGNLIEDALDELFIACDKAAEADLKKPYVIKATLGQGGPA